jgi:hypothetical protein
MTTMLNDVATPALIIKKLELCVISAGSSTVLLFGPSANPKFHVITSLPLTTSKAMNCSGVFPSKKSKLLGCRVSTWKPM